MTLLFPLNRFHIVLLFQSLTGWAEWWLWHTSSADIASARQSPSVTPKHATLYASLEKKTSKSQNLL